MYKVLYKTYGPQGWWPIVDYGYHPLNYDFPRNKKEIFEVCLGSILTQNTTFPSVVKSLENLKKANALSAKAIVEMDGDALRAAIRPSGYFNQKAAYILEFIKFYDSLHGAIPKREDLLALKGIGEETADSILLYGYNQCEFKVDAYTKRLLLHYKIVDEKAKYIDIKNMFEKEIQKEIKNKDELIVIYQEFHALIVCHSKIYYSKQPYGNGCFLKDIL